MAFCIFLLFKPCSVLEIALIVLSTYEGHELPMQGHQLSAINISLSRSPIYLLCCIEK